MVAMPRRSLPAGKTALFSPFLPLFPRPVAKTLLVFCLGLGAACTPPGNRWAEPKSSPSPLTGTNPEAVAPVDAAFDGVAQKFLRDYFDLFPEEATAAGEHSHDDAWPDPSVEGERRILTFIDQTRRSLPATSVPISQQRRIDAAIIRNRLAYLEFSLRDLREAENNPVYYTRVIGDGIDPLLTRDFAPAAERFRLLEGRLRALPAFLDKAKARLARPPRIVTETAMAQNRGLLGLVRSSLGEFYQEAPARTTYRKALGEAIEVALKEFQEFLETDLLPRSNGDFRLGKARFEQKLSLTLEDEVDAREIDAGARKLLAETQESMVSTAQQVWTHLRKGPVPALGSRAEKMDFIRRALDAVAEDRPTNETILADARRHLKDATKFVRKNDLVRIPEEPCRIIEMPEYRRGVSVAYCDSTGPLEAKQETFYAIAPTPAEWPAPRVKSFYREYNQSMLAELTVHEAMPGHYLQAMHANAFPSKVRAVFANGAFVEGWAVYAEWLLAKAGFGGPTVKLMREKMTLRLAANAILDHGIHAGTMTEKEGMALMMGEAFQEEGEAVGKWKRALLTSAQLTTYYYGLTQMLAIRAKLENRPGFAERSYNDKLLSFGAPSFKHLRVLMARDWGTEGGSNTGNPKEELEDAPTGPAGLRGLRFP